MNSKNELISQKSSKSDPAMTGLKHLKDQLSKIGNTKQGEGDGYVAMVINDDTKGTMSQATLAAQAISRAPVMNLDKLPDDYTLIRNPNGMPLSEK